MKKKSLILDILEVVITVAVLSFILLKFIVLPCEVNGSSMYPTLVDGQRAYSLKIARTLGINRFDICVIDVENEDREKLIVKRIIGMPNDEVEYKDNKLFINGKYIEEPFLHDVTTQDLSITLKDDEYFCLGDNRNISKDSRFYGPFKADKIISTKLFVIYPFSDLGVKQ